MDKHISRTIGVSSKKITHRTAIAIGRISLKPNTLKLIIDKKLEKGNALEVASVAGISAAKETSHLIPMCHPISITNIKIDYDIKHPNIIDVKATVEAIDRTGAEMEALTAVAVCCLTIYDMCKSIDREMTIENICLLEKKGGKSGHFKRSKYNEKL